MLSGIPMLQGTTKVGELDLGTSGTSMIALAKEERENLREIELPSISKYSVTSSGKKYNEIDDLDLFIEMKSSKI